MLDNVDDAENLLGKAQNVNHLAKRNDELAGDVQKAAKQQNRML